MKRKNIFWRGVLASLIFLWPLIVVAQTGQSDTTYRIDLVGDFFTVLGNYSSTAWKIDPDSTNVYRALNTALLRASVIFEDACQSKQSYITSDSVDWDTLPSDYMGIIAVTEVDPGKPGEIGVDPEPLNDIGKMTSVNDTKPKYYCVYDHTIYFDPHNNDNDTLFVYYRAYAAKLDSDSAVSNVCKKYNELVVQWAVIEFFAGRQGTAVDRIIALADKRAAELIALLTIKPASIVPDVK
jgi:hypothetical protein